MFLRLRGPARAQVNPGAGDTAYHAEYGPEPCSTPGVCQSTPRLDGHAEAGTSPVAAIVHSGRRLEPGTLYHYRVVAENESGTGEGAERTFTTLPVVTPRQRPLPQRPRPPADQRRGAARLPRLRARLRRGTRAAMTSSPTSSPARLRSAAIPRPTARSSTASTAAASPARPPDQPRRRPLCRHSRRTGLDDRIRRRPGRTIRSRPRPSPRLPPAPTRAWTPSPSAARKVCSPCFEDGYTGIPVRLPNGEPRPGHGGSVDPGPSAEAGDGFIAKPLSADGSHFVFGSTARFAPGGNDKRRRLDLRPRPESGETHSSPRRPGAATMTGDGHRRARHFRRRLADPGRPEGLRSRRRPYYHLYMNIGDSATPSTSPPARPTGVLFDGMTADGSRVFFTTTDQLTPRPTRTPTRAPISMRPKSPAGEQPTLTGSRPAPGSRQHRLLRAGLQLGPCPLEHARVRRRLRGRRDRRRGGVASGDGTIYFLSPEKLDAGADGVEDAPTSTSSGPGRRRTYVATLESVLNGPQPPQRSRAFEGNFGSFTRPPGLAVDHAER